MIDRILNNIRAVLYMGRCESCGKFSFQRWLMLWTPAPDFLVKVCGDCWDWLAYK